MNCEICNKPVDKETQAWVEFFARGSKEPTSTRHETCDNKRLREDYLKTGYISTHLMTDVSLVIVRAEYGEAKPEPVDKQINEAVERIHQDVKKFDVEAWFGGVTPVMGKKNWTIDEVPTYPRTKDSLQSIIEDSPHRTIEAKLNDFTVTGQCFLGRGLVELESETARITLVTAEKEDTSRMGILGIQGTEEECRRMINLTRENWRSLKFKKYKEKS